MTKIYKFILAVIPFILITSYLIFSLESAKAKANGKEITLKVISKDPTDFFRGDYVNLNYDIEEFQTTDKTPRLGKDFTSGSICFSLSENNGFYKVDDVINFKDLNIINLKNGNAYICGYGYHDYRGKYSMQNKNISKYFVPKNKGWYIDKMARENRLSAVISVTKDGNAYIKYLKVDDLKVDFSKIEER